MAKKKIFIKPVIPYHIAGHIDLAYKLNEIIEAVNSLAAGKLPAAIEAPAVQSEQTKAALEKIEQTLGQLEEAVGALAAARQKGVRG